MISTVVAKKKQSVAKMNIEKKKTVIDIWHIEMQILWFKLFENWIDNWID
jgi:hypothetical protein